MPPRAAFSMNLRSPLETLDAVALAVELFEPIWFEPARCSAFELAASLRAAGDAGDWLVVAVERLVLLLFDVPGEAVCAQTAAATQNDTAPTMRAGIERRLVDMTLLRFGIAGSRRIAARLVYARPASPVRANTVDLQYPCGCAARVCAGATRVCAPARRACALSLTGARVKVGRTSAALHRDLLTP